MIQKEGEKREGDRALKELKAIKNLLILSLLKSGATLEEVNFATGMGIANISRMFPVKRRRKKNKSSQHEDQSVNP